jgi:hypothetical protein
MSLVCYYRGSCEECNQYNVYGWTLDSKFMCCACHDYLEYCDTRHAPSNTHVNPTDCIVEYIKVEEQIEIPEELFDKLST